MLIVELMQLGYCWPSAENMMEKALVDCCLVENRTVKILVSEVAAIVVKTKHRCPCKQYYQSQCTREIPVQEAHMESTYHVLCCG